ncbi:AraC family transcriptional regulator [Pedobacter mucosus]|uniref:AraC family transcriptional regulator n=1 Tax=Pedobacter mucosus TaxID=2895286 RepID=UPI001EE412A4|nr:helix-turn-helix domain-containing protein [Pedobacter mucosus]UKT64657.1 helix-turn-helix domain-containing protein [Pedobacter mucosus]
MIQLDIFKGIYKKELGLKAVYPLRILIVKEGKGSLHMDSGDYAIQPNRVFFIPEEGIIRLDGEVTFGYWLSFSCILYAEFLQQHLDPLAKNLFLTLSFKDLDEPIAVKTYSLLEHLKKEIEAEKEIAILAQYLSLILGITAGLNGYLAVLTLDELQLALRFRAILEQFYKREKSIKFYAEGMGMSPRRLNVFLGRVLSKSLAVLLKERIIREAEELLIHSEHSIEEIAEILGFPNTANFNTTFRRYKGISPLQFAYSN